MPSFTDVYVTVNGVRLHAVKAGQGPLLLFLHGFPEFWYAWRNQLQEFGKDHLAVAPDLRGYNLSEKPALVSEYRPEVLVEDIRQLADQFRAGRKFVLVGHDWGGALAWAFAMAYPSYLEKLIIINAPHPAIFNRLLASDPEQQQASQYMLLFRSSNAEEILSDNNYAALVEVVLADLLVTGAIGEADKAAYLKAWSEPGALTGGLNYYRAIALGPPSPGDRQGLPLLEPASGSGERFADRGRSELRVDVPTLVLWGEKDVALVTRNLDGLDQFVRELTVERIPEGSHWVVHEHPRRINAAIRSFLEGSAPT